jgi:hypothetical protein
MLRFTVSRKQGLFPLFIFRRSKWLTPISDMEDKIEPYQYQWIINEGLLRDEGVLFGIAGAAIDDKITAIRDYYRIRKASAQTKRERLEKEIAEIRMEQSKLVADADDRESGNTPINFIPMTLQLALYGGICYFNFYLERYWLSPVVLAMPICMGLYLFGLFPVFLGRSVLYNSAQSLSDKKLPGGQPREAWKIYFEEFGVPLVVSLFIVILPGNAHALSFSIIAAFVFYLLFLLGGKGLVNGLYRVRSEMGRYWEERRKRKKRQGAERKLDALKEELGLTLSTLEELDGEEQYKINILTSEFKLALESRQLASNGSLKKLA